MHSHHSHSGQFCRHAKGTLSEVAEAAILKGFSVYGLTEHAPRYRQQDLYPEEVNGNVTYVSISRLSADNMNFQVDLSTEDLSSTFDSFIDEAHRVCAQHSSLSTTFLVGLETDYITKLDLQMTDKLLVKHGDRIDYIVGSVHHVNEIPIDFDKTTFERALSSFKEADASDSTSSTSFGPNISHEYRGLVVSYLDSQYILMQELHPEIVGHFDLFRLYNPSIVFSATSTPSIWERITRNVRYGIEYGALFEVNTAAFRKGWDTGYPGQEIALVSVPRPYHHPLSHVAELGTL